MIGEEELKVEREASWVGLEEEDEEKWVMRKERREKEGLPARMGRRGSL